MNPRLEAPAAAVLARAADAARRPADPRLIHVCGGCKTLHFAEGGRLRPLTPAERFALEVEVPHLVRAAVSGTYAPSAVPTGTLIVGDR